MQGYAPTVLDPGNNPQGSLERYSFWTPELTALAASTAGNALCAVPNGGNVDIVVWVISGAPYTTYEYAAHTYDYAGNLLSTTSDSGSTLGGSASCSLNSGSNNYIAQMRRGGIGEVPESGGWFRAGANVTSTIGGPTPPDRTVAVDILGILMVGFCAVLSVQTGQDLYLIDDILIQTGDVIDRGPHPMEAFDLLKRLQKEAALARGEVVRLCGNHELMLLQNDSSLADFSYPESFVDRLKNEIARGDVRASYTDGERLYTHAGLRSATREFLLNEMRSEKPKLKTSDIDLFLLSDHINKILIDSVKKADFEHPIFYVDSVRGGDDPVGGIFWCDFRSISPSMGAWKMPQIFGHSPTRKNGVNTAKGLKLIDVDAGMYHFSGGKRVWLEITPEGHLLQHSKARSKWTSKLLS